MNRASLRWPARSASTRRAHRGAVADRAGELGQQLAGARRARHREQEHRRDEVAGRVVELGGELADRGVRVLPRQPRGQALTSGRIGSGQVRAVAAIVPMIPCSAVSRSRSCSHHDASAVIRSCSTLTLDSSVGERPDGDETAEGAGERGDDPARQHQGEQHRSPQPATNGERGRSSRSVRRRGPADPATTLSIEVDDAEPGETTEQADEQGHVSAAPRCATARAPNHAGSSPTRRGRDARGAATTGRGWGRGCRRRRVPTARSC